MALTAAKAGIDSVRTPPPFVSPPRGVHAGQGDDVHLGAIDPHQAALPLASDGVLRWVWHSRFGDMLIEVAGGDVFVNGDRVEPHAP